MEKVPFGVGQLDSILGGGVPAGHVVLLASDAGAGGREFLYTCAAMHGLARGDPELFDLHYGSVDDRASLLPAVHYLSFTADEEYIAREMAYTIDGEIVDAAVDEIAFRDLSPEYFQFSPIPRGWYTDETGSLADLGKRHDREDVTEALGAYLSENAPGNLVCLDSLTDLVAVDDGMSWAEVATLLKGLEKAAHDWGGLIVALVSAEALQPTELGHLVDAAGGTLQFEWESGGSRRARTMVVRSFRGVLSRLESENIVRFETEIHEGGIDVSDVRKIR